MFGLIIAFKNYNYARNIWTAPWVGLKWFKLFFGNIFLKNSFAFRLVRNTFMLNIYSILFGFPAPLLFALLLNEIKGTAFKRTVQTISYLPHFVSVAIIVGILQEFAGLRGLFNDILVFLGGKAIIFFAEPKWFRTLFVGSEIWQQMGWSAIIYLAALSRVNPELYEQAMLDGANRFRKIIHIDIPTILPTVSILFILRMPALVSMGNTQKILLMYNPLTYETADILGTYIFREGIQNQRFAYATAVGLFMSVLAFLVLMLANYLTKKATEHSLW